MPELAAALVAVHHLALEQERAAEEARARLVHLAGRHQRRGSGSRRPSRPSTSTSGTTRVSNSALRAQQLGVALGALPEAEVLPDRHAARRPAARPAPPRRTARRFVGELAGRRDHHQLLHPEPGDQVALDRERSAAAWAAPPGGSTASGCGSKVSTVSMPRITSRWPRCTPSNVPIATARRSRGPASGRRRDLHRGNTTTGFSRSSPRLGDRDQPLAVGQPHGAPARRRPASSARRRAPTALGLVGVERALRQERQRLRQRHAPARGSASSSRNGPIAVRSQLLAVGVAQAGDQLAHVGARRALDLERGALAVAPEQLEAVHGDRPRLGTSTASPAARLLVQRARRPPSPPSRRAGAA